MLTANEPEDSSCGRKKALNMIVSPHFVINLNRVINELLKKSINLCHTQDTTVTKIHVA